MKINALRPIQILNKEIKRQVKEWKTLENKMLYLAYIDYFIQYIRKEKLKPEQRVFLQTKNLIADIQYISNIHEKPIAVIEIDISNIRLYTIFPAKDYKDKYVQLILSEHCNGSSWITKFNISLGEKVYYEVLRETRDK